MCTKIAHMEELLKPGTRGFSEGLSQDIFRSTYISICMFGQDAILLRGGGGGGASSFFTRITQITVRWWPIDGPPAANPMAHRRLPPVGHHFLSVGPLVAINTLVKILQYVAICG